MFTRLVKVILATSIIAAILNRSKSSNDNSSKPSEAFEKATTQSTKNRKFVEVPYDDNAAVDSNQADNSEPFVQSPG